MDHLSVEHLAWLERQHDRADNTIASRRRVLNSITNPGTATRADIIRWWESRAHLADGTRAVDRSHLKEFYRWCMIYEHRTDDPSVILRPVTVENALPAKISNDQIRALLDTLPTDLSRAVMLGAFAGLRISESAALDWSEVDTAEDVLRVMRSKGKKSRYVPVSPELIRLLATDGTAGNVVTANRAPFTAPQLQRRLNRAMRSAGAEFTTHDLRHRWGLTAYRLSHDLLAVAEMMGHSSVNTTKVYASADSETKRKIASGVMF